MRVDLFDFELPENLIALHPAKPRDSAKMLVVQADSALRDARVGDLPELIDSKDILVVNDTKVLPVALTGVRYRGESTAQVSVLLHGIPRTSATSAFARPAKRLKPGDRIRFGEAVARACARTELDATVEEVREGGEVILAFDLSGPVLDEAIRAHGAMPLPPYVSSRRAVEEEDDADYQTVYAARDGAIAAPTAGLHFTDDLLARLSAKGVEIARVTLHVGPGTFRPVKADDTDDHKMHAEWGEVNAATAEAINRAKARGGRVIAVGTTSLRVLESAAREDGSIEPFTGETDIFIVPGYRFRAVDVLMTNFHLPRSTLFMLVSAFSGLETMKRAYHHAIADGYRFYSYGDASLLFKS